MKVKESLYVMIYFFQVSATELSRFSLGLLYNILKFLVSRIYHSGYHQLSGYPTSKPVYIYVLLHVSSLQSLVWYIQLTRYTHRPMMKPWPSHLMSLSFFCTARTRNLSMSMTFTNIHSILFRWWASQSESLIQNILPSANTTQSQSILMDNCNIPIKTVSYRRLY